MSNALPSTQSSLGLYPPSVFAKFPEPFKTFERIFSLLDFSLLRLVPVACLVQYDFVTVGDISCSSLSGTAQRSGGVYVRHVAERVCRNDWTVARRGGDIPVRSSRVTSSFLGASTD